MPSLLAPVLVFDLLLAWLLWRMLRQSRRYVSLGEAGPEAPEGGWPRLAVIVPARNEAASIRRCIAGLLRQNYPVEQLSILLVDDGSTDGTGEIAREVAAGDARFRLLRGATLPEGWTGKAFACWQGTHAAAADWLCFIDADTAAEPGLLSAAMAEALRSRLDMLSLAPFQELGSPVERLVLPCGFYLIAASQDFSRINAPDHPFATANGQFILLRRAAYDRLGGHAAVRSEICEDAALARLAKGGGFRIAMLGAERLIRTRMYRDAPSLWSGLSKNASEIAGGPGKTVLVAALGFGFVIFALALAGAVGVRLVAGASALDLAAAAALLPGLLAMVGLHVAGCRHFRIPIVYGSLFPIGYAMTLAVAVNSARLALVGRVPWKDRVYARPRSERSARLPRRAGS